MVIAHSPELDICSSAFYQHIQTWIICTEQRSTVSSTEWCCGETMETETEHITCYIARRQTDKSLFFFNDDFDF